MVDLYNDEVVAYSISRSPNMKMVLEMLAGLEGRLDGEGAPLLHSDMGWQYQMPAYRLALERMGIAQSMSRKGNCLDNAKAENFFSMVKTELYYDWEGDDPDIFERDLEKYIDWYNNVRIKSVYCQALADKIGVMISTLSAFRVPTSFSIPEIYQA